MFKNLYDKIIYRLITNQVNQRVQQLERRTLNRRFAVLDDLAGYLAWSEIEGDYAEFGVYCGNTFSYAFERLSGRFPKMRFNAFDSFEGLPEPEGLDVFQDGYAGAFFGGQFSCSEVSFRETLAQRNVDMNKVSIISGWFDKSLKADNPKLPIVDKVALAWIDCDLYESTIPVLDYLTSRISVGSVIAFDDWHCYRNLPDRGEQRACNEWLKKNPNITLNRLFSFGWHGVAFSVGSC